MNERVTERTDGVTQERVIERGPETGTTTIVREGGGMGGIMIALAVVALIVVAGLFYMNVSRNDALRTEAVSDAASSVAKSAENASQSVGDAAQRVAPAQ
ncbi:hypothetical protein CSW58_11920 [Caulobacter sp. B11]|uniref:hypothetical protein n=1 Tax=Caulobacter sp. B11 TaxID=2048899 RepID=UPI000C12C77B|nr:hypothetical protein [Caulobacter sp. B11]PHY12540.1 hypothetical protein CSW58_11920 [Caulobacter sp. B11]